jgi:hypothetical protein
MSNTADTTSVTSRRTRWLVIALTVLVAFFASYRFAQAQNPNAQTTRASSGLAGAVAGTAGAGAAGCCGGASTTPAAPGRTDPNAQAQAGAPGGGCCGGGGPAISKQAEVTGGVQRIAVDLSSGSYNPSEIVLKAGVPAEITFGQSSGCTAQVQSQDLGFFEDLTGGPKTVGLPALKAGTYTFSCGMQMVFGSIVVK